jgi:hypothetical protein
MHIVRNTLLTNIKGIIIVTAPQTIYINYQITDRAYRTIDSPTKT